MREVTPRRPPITSARRGACPRGEAVAVRALGWGVSNVVLRVEVEGQPPFVLKQARERLRTRAHWVSRLDRIWTEHAALECLAPLLPRGAVPEVLFADRENYLFAMTCAPDDSVVWKEQLLEGVAEPERRPRRRGPARARSTPRRSITRRSSDGPLADTVVFDQLRIDPFYRTIARVHPEIAAPVEALCHAPGLPGPRCFVHADFSPKNILVHARGLTLVDFETAHAGDPAYDLGFVLSHLLLKAARAGHRRGARPGPDRRLPRRLPRGGPPRSPSATSTAAPPPTPRPAPWPGSTARAPSITSTPPARTPSAASPCAALLDPPASCSDLLPLLAREMRQLIRSAGDIPRPTLRNIIYV